MPGGAIDRKGHSSGEVAFADFLIGSAATDPQTISSNAQAITLCIVTSVGIRPCTGAILVLVFALTQGLNVHSHVMNFGVERLLQRQREMRPPSQ